MFSVPIILFALAASLPAQETPVLRASTAKSLNEFGSCFARTQEEKSRPWAFMPNNGGGTFTNASAKGVTASYRLQISEAAPQNQVRLFAGAHSAKLVEAVNRCR